MAAPSKPVAEKTVKLLVIGDSGVGKTSLLVRFDQDSFSPNFISTIGIDYKVKNVDIDGKKVKLQIWDTGGQERFRNITTTYYRGAHGIMLVYDVTDPITFDGIRSWMSALKNHTSDDLPKILAGTKCDMADRRVISTQRGQDLANEYGISFFETSAKSSYNVEEAFTSLAQDAFHKMNTDPSAQTTSKGFQLNPEAQQQSAPTDQKSCAC